MSHLFHPHYFLLLISDSHTDTAVESIKVTPGIGSNSAIKAGHCLQLGLIFPGTLQKLVLSCSKALKNFPEIQAI